MTHVILYSFSIFFLDRSAIDLLNSFFSFNGFLFIPSMFLLHSLWNLPSFVYIPSLYRFKLFSMYYSIFFCNVES
jgi:hypothetical protein